VRDMERMKGKEKGEPGRERRRQEDARRGHEDIEETEETGAVANVKDGSVEEGVKLGVEVGVFPRSREKEGQRRNEEGKSGRNAQAMLRHERKETIESENTDRSSNVRTVNKPIHQPPRFRHMRQDLTMQHDQYPLTVLLPDWQRQDGKTAVLEDPPMRDERKKGGEALLPLRRVERLDRFVVLLPFRRRRVEHTR
jgi:hypothetical protein